MKKYVYDEETVTIKKLIEENTVRYVGKVLTRMEETPPHLHPGIVKRHLYWMMDDILKIIDS